MALACGRYNARSDWLRPGGLSGHYAAVMPTGRLRIMQIRKSPALKIQAHRNDESQFKTVRESKLKAKFAK